ELQAEISGRLEILFPEAATTVKPGDVIAYIDDSAEKPKAPASSEPTRAKEESTPAPQAALPKTPAKTEAPPLHTAEEPIWSPAARKIAAEKNLDTASLKGSGKAGRIMKEDVVEAPAQEKAPQAPLPSGPTPSPALTAAASPF